MSKFLTFVFLKVRDNSFERFFALNATDLSLYLPFAIEYLIIKEFDFLNEVTVHLINSSYNPTV